MVAACVAPRKGGAPVSISKSMMPRLPSAGEVSNVTLMGPISLTVWPVSPCARQNGVG